MADAFFVMCQPTFFLDESTCWRERLQRSEQYFTSSQHCCHFLRQVNGRWQTTHTLAGKLDFLCITCSYLINTVLVRLKPFIGCYFL